MNVNVESPLRCKAIPIPFTQRTEISQFSFTLDPKSFDYKFLATLDGRGQVIPNDGDKERGERVTNVTRIIT